MVTHTVGGRAVTGRSLHAVAGVVTGVRPHEVQLAVVGVDVGEPLVPDRLVVDNLRGAPGPAAVGGLGEVDRALPDPQRPVGRYRCGVEVDVEGTSVLGLVASYTT